MLPNWLLGKSKSKLQEILGGGGGASYTAGDGIDITSGVISFDPETTPAIDPSKIDGLSDDLADLAPKAAISNPNILHNPWFTVNQRGFTTGTTYPDYLADRWKYSSSSLGFTISRASDGAITIDNTNNATTVFVLQKRTPTYITSLRSKQVTASIMLSDGTIYKGTKSIPSTGSIRYFENDDLTLDTNVSTNDSLIVNVKPGASVTIKALKLEVGEISTLHLDPRPEYATELAKCQRYFERIGNTQNMMIGSGMYTGTTYCTISAKCAPKRSSNATVTFNGTAYCWDNEHTGANALQSTNISSVIISKEGNCWLTFDVTGATKGQAALAQFRDTTSYIDLNAEL